MRYTEHDTVDIRPWSDGDLALLEQLMGDPVMTEHLGGPEAADKIRERHERYCRLTQSGPDAMFVIVVGTERSSAGSIGYWQKEWQGECVWETGWSVLPEFQGKGVATRAVGRIVERTTSQRTHRSLHAFPSVHNAASNAICRKAGFTLLGQFDFEYPPGHPVRCNDWCLDLIATVPDGRTRTDDAHSGA